MRGLRGRMWLGWLARGGRPIARFRIVVLGFLCYVALLLALLPLIGAAASVLLLALAALAGAATGVRIGILVTLLMYAFTGGLLVLAGHHIGDVVVTLGSGLGALVVIAVAAGFGRMRELARRSEALSTELGAKEERLRRIIADAPIAIYVTDSRGTCTFAGGAALSTIGVSEQELLGRNFRDRPGEPVIMDAIGDALAGTEVKKRVAYGGRMFEAHIAPMTDERDDHGMIAVAVDVTGSEQMLDALRGAEERLRAIVTSFPLIALTLDPDGKIARSEGSGLTALGLGRGELDGRSILDLARGRDVEAIRQALAGDRKAVRAEIAGTSVELRFAGNWSATPPVIVASAIVPQESSNVTR